MASPIPRLGASLPLPPDLDMCRRVAEHAEILGYESLWIADTGAGPDAFVVAAVARASAPPSSPSTPARSPCTPPAPARSRS